MSVRAIERCAEQNALLSDPRVECLAQLVEAAVQSMQAHLNPEQAEVVRSVLRASVETDPVLRILAAARSGCEA